MVAIRSLIRLTLLLAMLTTALMCDSVATAQTVIYYNSELDKAQPLPAPPVVRNDTAVATAVHTEPPVSKNIIDSTPHSKNSQTASDPRRLAPRSSGKYDNPPTTASNSDRAALPFSTPQIESLGTAGAGLAIVVGLFLLCAWLLRRGGPKPTSALPKEVVSVLGRIPLVGRNFAQLIQIGNKLILVSITTDGVATPITEVTDPQEVDRLLAICTKNRKHSTTAEFQQVLQQLAREPAKGFLGS